MSLLRQKVVFFSGSFSHKNYSGSFSHKKFTQRFKASSMIFISPMEKGICRKKEHQPRYLVFLFPFPRLSSWMCTSICSCKGYVTVYSKVEY